MRERNAAEIVNNLNEEILDHYAKIRDANRNPPPPGPIPTFEENEEPVLTLTTDGSFQAVMFLGQDIWCSEDDPRPCRKSDAMPIDLAEFLRKQINDFMAKLGILRL